VGRSSDTVTCQSKLVDVQSDAIGHTAPALEQACQNWLRNVQTLEVPQLLDSVPLWPDTRCGHRLNEQTSTGYPALQPAIFVADVIPTRDFVEVCQVQASHWTIFFGPTISPRRSPEHRIVEFRCRQVQYMRPDSWCWDLQLPLMLSTA